jgi:tetratricopeptide (TPR) repeat protein
LGPWFVVNVSQEFDEKKHLLRNGVSLWEARRMEMIGQTALAEAMLRAWLEGAEEATPAGRRATATAKNNLGVLLLNQGKRPEGEALLRQAQALNPEAAVISYNLGVCLLQSRGDGAAARAFLLRAMESDRNNVRLHEEFRQALQAQARSLQVPIVSMDEEVFVSVEETAEPLYFIDYTHPSRIGHRLLAEKLYAELLKPRNGLSLQAAFAVRNSPYSVADHN